MSKINTLIKHQFKFYEELVYGKKICRSKQLLLKPKRSNVRWLSGHSEVDHSTVEDNIHLIVEQNRIDKKYGIKLRCKTLTDVPFFRFDSDGPAHRNVDPTIPLSQQSISTPHFNGYNSAGQSIAYKTDVLKRDGDAEAIVDDLNFGLIHFCTETNMSLIDNIFPEVLQESPELHFPKRAGTFTGVKFE